MKIKLTLIVILVLCATFFKTSAQTTVQNFTPSHLKAAENFLIATGVNLQFNTIAENAISALGTRIPENQREAFVQVMKKFMAKYYNWDVLKVELSKSYAEEFTESELIQLTNFYNTPIGKKYGEKMPKLTQKGALLGQQIMVQHQDELQQMMQDALKGQ